MSVVYWAIGCKLGNVGFITLLFGSRCPLEQQIMLCHQNVLLNDVGVEHAVRFWNHSLSIASSNPFMSVVYCPVHWELGNLGLIALLSGNRFISRHQIMLLEHI